MHTELRAVDNVNADCQWAPSTISARCAEEAACALNQWMICVGSLVLGVIIQGPFWGQATLSHVYDTLSHFLATLSHFKPPETSSSHFQPLKTWVQKVPQRGGCRLFVVDKKAPGFCRLISGLPNANAKSQRFCYAIFPHRTPAPNRSKSQL